MTTLPGGVKVFAGQREDPFFVDLGSIFDLAGLRPFNPFHLIPLAAAPGVDALANYNTHSIAIQVPIAQTRQDPEHQHRRSTRAPAGRSGRSSTKDGTNAHEGPFVQVSRLGNPLINEVLIPLGQKDHWNRSEPEDDSQFDNRYTTSEVAGLENLLYGSVLARRCTDDDRPHRSRRCSS